MPDMLARSMMYLNETTSTKWMSRRGQIHSIRENALRVLDYAEPQKFLDDNKQNIATITFLAGAGSRWVKSVLSAKKRGEALDVDPDKPRCLAPVEDVINPGKKVPIGTYNLAALKGIGRHFVVYRTHLQEIKSMAHDAGLDDVTYFEQTVPGGASSPLGHGDALRQLLPALPDSLQFVITNFGGDPNSKETMITSLLVLAAMQRAKENLKPYGLMPTAYFANPTYPITVRKDGLPIDFAHRKLKASPPAADNKPAQTNVGIRLYMRGALKDVIFHYEKYYDPQSGYKLDGNVGNEFGLDNIDAYLSKPGRFRLLCVARPEEIKGSAKTWENIESFVAAMKMILGK